MIFTPFSFIKTAAATGAWTPADFANVYYWFASDSGVGLSGTDVITWTDKIVSAELTLYEGGTPLQYNASDAQFNDKPSIYQNKNYVTLYRNIPAWNNTDDRTIIFVGQPEPIGIADYQMWGGVTTTGGVYSEQVPYVCQPSVIDKVGAFFSPGGNRSTTTDPVEALSWQAVAYDSSAGSVKQFYNSPTAIQTDTGLSANPDKGGGLFEVGGYESTPGLNFKGYILEAILIRGLPSDEEWDLFNTYVTNTYS